MSKSMILTAEQALNTYKGQSLSQLNKAAVDLTKVEGDASIMRRVISICYWAGVACKAKGLDEKATEKTVGDTYLNFANGWYYKGAGGKREPLEPGTLENYKSAVQGFGLLGTTEWNSTECILAVMHAKDSKGKPLSLGSQGSKARKFAGMEAKPSAKEIADALKGKAPTRTRNIKAILVGLCDRVEEVATDSDVVKAAKDSGAVGANVKAILIAAAMLRDALLATDASAEAKKATKASVAAMRKAAGSIPHKPKLDA